MRWLSLIVVGFLSATSAFAQEEKTLVMVAGHPSHGTGQHEFNAGVQLLAKCLQGVKGLKTEVHLGGWPADKTAFDNADAIFLYMDGGDNHPAAQGDHLQKLGALMDKGVGLMCAHYAVEIGKDNGGKEFQKWIGGYYETHFSVNPMWSPQYKDYVKHPVLNGVQPFSVEDEWYFNMRFAETGPQIVHLLLDKPSDDVRDGPYVSPRGPYPHIEAAKGRPETMMWAIERADGGRGVGFTGGHNHANWGDDNNRKAVLNALLWVSKVPVPEGGVDSTVTAEELKANLDPKEK